MKLSEALLPGRSLVEVVVTSKKARDDQRPGELTDMSVTMNGTIEAPIRPCSGSLRSAGGQSSRAQD
ncbi:MAG: hypothetical protein F4X98_09270 [Gammaproteobacteria bacterium]|nr:hypothetical protein [Gammaproteobacteria bacterium]